MPTLALLLSLVALSANAGEEEDLPAVTEITDIEQLSLADLLNVQTSVATQTAMGAREAPGILTVITREQIVRSGARDLLDILDKLVPGFQWGVDTWGVVAPGVRGNWAAEGKIAVIVDGLEYSEGLYNYVPFGNHFLSENIERVEVIRGPGSAKYGGVAELAVVRVTTRISDPEWQGVDGWARYGTVEDLSLARADVGSEWAGALGDDGRIGIGARIGTGRRSNDPYSDLWGNTYDMSESSDLDPLHAAVQIQKNGLLVHAGLDRYILRHRDNFTRANQLNHGSDFNTYFGRLAYQAEIGERVTVTPRAHLRRQYPWKSVINVPLDSFNYIQLASDQYAVGVDVQVDASDRLDLAFGADARHERAYVRAIRFEPGYYDYFGESTLGYSLGSAYAEAIVPIPDVLTITVGGRVDYHEQFGLAGAPRLALTRAWDKAHAKLLAARGYRTPGIEVLHYTPDAIPETVWIFEAEAGVGLGEAVYATVNVHDTTQYDSLLYFYNYDAATDTESEGYENGERAGSRGGELTVRASTDAVDLSAHYAMYDATGKNRVPRYQVADAPGANLGFANHKAGAQLTAKAGDHFTATPGVIVLGPRWVYTSTTGARDRVQETLPVAAVLDLSLRYADLGIEGLDVALTGFDLLDANPGFPQPYDGFHGALPDMGRELMLSVHMRR